MICLMSVPNEPVGSTSLNGAATGPKMGIESIVHYMKKEGYSDDLYDFFDAAIFLPSDDEIRDYLMEYKPKIIGLSAVVSGSYSQVKRISKIVRDNLSDTLIVVGGNLAITYEIILEKTDVDICVLGPGEMAWIELIKYNEKYKNIINAEVLGAIKGVAFKGVDKIYSTGYGDKTNELVFPDYEFYKRSVKNRTDLLDNYFVDPINDVNFRHDKRIFEEKRKGKKIAAIFTSKGCTAACTFCQRSYKGYDNYDLGKMEEYVRYLVENHNIGYISISDENFGSDKKYGREVAKLFVKYDLLWAAGGVRCVSVKEEDINFYKEHNCTSLKYGVESGSQYMLDIMEKKLDMPRIITNVVHTTRSGLVSPLAFLLGMPGETNETVKETGRMVGEICLRLGVLPIDMFASSVAFNLVVVFPGTPAYDYSKKIGIFKNIDEEEEYLEKIVEHLSGTFSYVNICGESEKDIFFWKKLVMLEANRFFYKNYDTLYVEPNSETISIIKSLKNVVATNIESSKKVNKLLYFKMYLTGYINRIVMFKIFLFFPERIVDSMLRNFYWYLNILSKFSFKGKLNTKFTTTKQGKHLPSLNSIFPDLKDNGTRRIERSLRTIAKKLS